MAWEENSCIWLNMQLIAILSRIGVVMTTNKVTAEKTCEFLLYFMLLMVYSGVFYLLGFDITGESSDWHVILYFLVLNIVTTPTTNLIIAQWNKRKQ